MNEKTKSLLIKVAVVVAAVLVIGLVVYNNLFTSGALQRSQTAVASEHFSVDGMMFGYFYGTQYQNYSSVFSYLGVQTGTSMKSQACPYMSDGGSWFDYLVSSTRDYVKNMLALCEIGYQNGNTLTAEDKKTVDDSIAALEESASAYGYSANNYLRMVMGNPVNVKDARKCMELTTLAQKAYNQIMDSLSYTDEQLDAYAAENEDTLVGVDLLSYSFNATSFRKYDADSNPTSTSEEESAAAKEAAETVAKATDAAGFESALREVLKGTDMTDEDIDTAVASTSRIHALKTSLGEEVSDWAFSASVGNTKTTGEEGDTSFGVYMLTRKPYRDETKTRNVRHILFTKETYADSSKADEVYAEWEAAGFSVDKFVELAAQYSEDPGSKDKGGLYEDVTPGSMVSEFNDWLFDSARKPGDHAIVETSDYGWHIMYYEGESDKVVWRLTAESALKNEDYNALVEQNETNITFNEKVAKKLNG